MKYVFKHYFMLLYNITGIQVKKIAIFYAYICKHIENGIGRATSKDLMPLVGLG